MKKKKMPLWLSIIFSLSACAVIAFVIFILDTGAGKVYTTKTMEQVGALVVKRAETMNDYYTGELEYIHAEEILRDVETGKLLEDDLKNLTAWESTDIDQVDQVEILEVILLEDRGEELSAQVIVNWNVSGLNGAEEFQVTYETVCEKNGKTLKLTQFF